MSTRAALRVVATGPRVLVQDHGRAGLAAQGVTTSGAVDRGSHDLANRLVGNDPTAATLEAVLGGLEVTAQKAVLLAVTGADVDVRVDDVVHPTGALVRVGAGQVVRLGPPHRGLRSYVAVRGGVDVPSVLGSRACDTLAGIGPAPLAVGDVLPVGDLGRAEPAVEAAPVDRRPLIGPAVVPVVLGPRDDWFTPVALHRLATATWTVGAESDRVGVRLRGPSLDRAVTHELPSEGMPLGAVQVTPTGPIVFLDDHPVTGGYPVVGVVPRAGLDLLAQRRAGEEVRLHVRPSTLRPA